MTFEDHQLPGRITNLRFADQSQSLAKMQVAEAMSTQHSDLHADGTTKKQQKYVGLQVTLENKQTLSLGFNAVAHETAQTILDLTLDRIQEFSVLNSEEDSENEKRKILQNLVGLMSDRTSNMKSAGRLLNEHRAAQRNSQIQQSSSSSCIAMHTFRWRCHLLLRRPQCMLQAKGVWSGGQPGMRETRSVQLLQLAF